MGIKISKRKRYLGYRAGVAWIAHNDNPGDNETREVMKGYISVMLLADLHDCDAELVAEDVLKYRLNHMGFTSPYQKEGE